MLKEEQAQATNATTRLYAALVVREDQVPAAVAYAATMNGAGVRRRVFTDPVSALLWEQQEAAMRRAEADWRGRWCP